jgi:hypothetical protein
VDANSQQESVEYDVMHAGTNNITIFISKPKICCQLDFVVLARTERRWQPAAISSLPEGNFEQ